MVYLVAHPDDWIYFMLPNLYHDVKSGCRVILIDVSAGSPDVNEPWSSSSIAQALRWSNAREMADSAAFGYAANSDLTASGNVTIDGHAISYRNYGASTTIIHLRLVTPATGQLTCGGTDRNFAATEGYGWPVTNCQSIGQLHVLGKPISAIDNSTTYSSWRDLVSTVQGILDYYGLPRNGLSIINGHEYDRKLDTTTHPDHIEVGNIAHEISTAGYSLRYYLSYTTAGLPTNIGDADLTIKQAIWQVYETAIGQALDSAFNDYQTHGQWLPRQYYRSISDIVESPGMHRPISG